jgi:hypothetical protein
VVDESILEKIHSLHAPASEFKLATCLGPWLQFDQQGKLMARPCQINIQDSYRTQAEESVEGNSKTFQHKKRQTYDIIVPLVEH